MDKYQIGDLVREWRESKRMSQKELGEISGLQTNDVSRVELGKCGIALSEKLYNFIQGKPATETSEKKTVNQPPAMAERLKKLRVSANLSQSQLARLAKVDQQYIARIENGETRKARRIPAIAAALGVAPEEIDPTFFDDNPTIVGPAFEKQEQVRRKEIMVSAFSEASDRDAAMQELSLIAMSLQPEFGFMPTLLQTVFHLQKRATSAK
jgi:transcriptional regulator with XRE-family HTH domain